MRTTLGSLGLLGIAALFATACGSETGGTGKVDLPPRGDGAGSASSDDGDAQDDEALLPSDDADDKTPSDPGTSPQTYCDEAQEIPGVKLIDDPLAMDAAKFGVAPGFDTASWSFDDEAYRQTRLVDAADATYFLGDSAIGDVDITVDAISTAVTSTIGPRLRQMFILVGATSTDGVLDAYGCGAEVVQGMSPEQRTSVVKLSGPANAITTTAIDRTARNVLQVGELYSMHAKLQNGTLTCTVKQGGDVVTTAQATNVGTLQGSVGFLTRQTKAAFKNVKACKLGTLAATPK